MSKIGELKKAFELANDLRKAEKIGPEAAQVARQAGLEKLMQRSAEAPIVVNGAKTQISNLKAKSGVPDWSKLGAGAGTIGGAALLGGSNSASAAEPEQAEMAKALDNAIEPGQPTQEKPSYIQTGLEAVKSGLAPLASGLAGYSQAADQIDKYTARPIRAGVHAALGAENPLTAAKEAITGDKNVEGKQINRRLTNLFREKPTPEDAPYSTGEELAGMATELPLDPTMFIGAGEAKGASKFFPKLAKYLK